jgi:hypothetical protein
MSGDHNMNQSDSGWRKRQIALDIKAENARELGLDYEPDKTIEMAREAGFVMHLSEQFSEEMPEHQAIFVANLKAFETLIRADEREACCAIVYGQCESDNVAQRTVDAIRSRGQA